MKQEQVEHLTKGLAHLNIALEHFDQVPLSTLLRHKDKVALRRFDDTCRTRLQPVINKMYDNEEQVFQVLQNSLEYSVNNSLQTIINDQVQRLSEGHNSEGSVDPEFNGVPVPLDGGADREDSNRSGDS